MMHGDNDIAAIFIIWNGGGGRCEWHGECTAFRCTYSRPSSWIILITLSMVHVMMVLATFALPTTTTSVAAWCTTLWGIDTHTDKKLAQNFCEIDQQGQKKVYKMGWQICRRRHLNNLRAKKKLTEFEVTTMADTWHYKKKEKKNYRHYIIDPTTKCHFCSKNTLNFSINNSINK